MEMKALNHWRHFIVMKLGREGCDWTRYVSRDPYLTDEIFYNWLGCFSHNSLVWLWVQPGPSVSWWPLILALYLHILSIVSPISRLTSPPPDILINCLSLAGWQGGNNIELIFSLLIPPLSMCLVPNYLTSLPPCSEVYILPRNPCLSHLVVRQK